jgi:hypothetical protein
MDGTHGSHRLDLRVLSAGANHSNLGPRRSDPHSQSRYILIENVAFAEKLLLYLCPPAGILLFCVEVAGGLAALRPVTSALCRMKGAPFAASMVESKIHGFEVATRVDGRMVSQLLRGSTPHLFVYVV